MAVFVAIVSGLPFHMAEDVEKFFLPVATGGIGNQVRIYDLSVCPCPTPTPMPMPYPPAPHPQPDPGLEKRRASRGVLEPNPRRSAHARTSEFQR